MRNRQLTYNSWWLQYPTFNYKAENQQEYRILEQHYVTTRHNIQPTGAECIFFSSALGIFLRLDNRP